MPTARWEGTSQKIFFILFIVFAFFISPKNIALANTTAYRSAITVTTDGNPQYINLSNCSGTDGNTCDRLQALSYANLYFRNFGDFNIPDNSTITNVRIRVTGKANIGIYAGVSQTDVIPGITFASNCQFPSDLWTMSVLNNANLTAYNVVTPLSNGTLASCLSLTNIRTNKFIWRINYSGSQSWYANIDNFEIAFDYMPPATPTPTPTPTPVRPFLDLPWDYEAKGQTFADAALAINSYFDHEYPLLTSGLAEPPELSDEITSFDGKSYPKQERSYSSHDGYDYGIPASVRLGDPVRAAAAGTAQYVDSCAPCGNMILIDHGNGYQTRYLHLQKDGLIISIPGVKVNVVSHQQIGKVGATGSVSPAGDAGAHIHFGVFEDKNHDGNFNDNVPDGVTDPFGWQSSALDPWENYSFFYNGLQRTGNKSYYLWKNPLGGSSATISPSGGNLNSGHYFMTFPSNAVSQNANIELTPEPIVPPSKVLSSLGPTLLALAKDQLGNPVTDFLNPFTLIVDFANLDLSNFDSSTLSVYSSQDSTSWNKEPTTVDLINKKASVSLSHFTHFALMAERLDSTPPVTTATLSGNKGENNWYRSDVTLSLSSQDNQGGLGVDYALLGMEGGNWDTYSSSIIATDEGHFKYEFYSVDKAGNIEDNKTIEFAIDKTPPEAQIQFNPDTLNIDIVGKDSSGSANVDILDIPKQRNSIMITDKAGNMLQMIGKDKQKGRNAGIVIESIQYNDNPLINIDPTSLFVTYNLDNKSPDLKRLTQTFVVRGETRISLVYSAKTNKTDVITKNKGQDRVKEELDGIRILKLTTENGKLNYSY